jgi:hypothetical protein
MKKKYLQLLFQIRNYITKFMSRLHYKKHRNKIIYDYC